MHVTVADFLSWTQQHPKTPGGKTQEVQSTNRYQLTAQIQPAFSLQSLLSRDRQETGRRKQLNESNCTFTRYEMLKLSNSVRWCWWTMINNHQNKLQQPELRKVRTGNSTFYHTLNICVTPACFDYNSPQLPDCCSLSPGGPRQAYMTI